LFVFTFELLLRIQAGVSRECFDHRRTWSHKAGCGWDLEQKIWWGQGTCAAGLRGNAVPCYSVPTS
jgi:hypothetical protein